MLKPLPQLPKKLNDSSNNLEQENKKASYYIQEHSFNDDDVEESEEFLEYDTIPLNEFEDLEDIDEDEDLEKAIRNNNEQTFFGAEVTKNDDPVVEIAQKPEVIDDFIRNFLCSKGLVKSLDAFQNEWYEMQHKGKLSPEDVSLVPDVYQRNQDLAEVLKKSRIEVENYKKIANNARATYDKLRKERDFHRMHHKRVVQEKNKLIQDIRRLKTHYENYEPTLKILQHKYEISMKEKMLTKLERDRLASKIVGLENSGATKQSNVAASVKSSKQQKTKKNILEKNNTQLQQPFQQKESSFPVEDRQNPYRSPGYQESIQPTKIEKLKLIQTIKAHELTISAINFHPKKMILATVSDDKTWKMFAFPSGELIMSGEGHKDWISNCDFHPRGTHLATSSGDHTVKIWDFTKGLASLTLSDHTQPVWSCGFHDTGDFLISGSMDHTAKLWDLQTGKCRQTLRGHADSVNQVGFQPYTNTIFTGSSDKTISFWDSRTGLVNQTFYGHLNSINDVVFNNFGEKFATCDADGVVKFWDIRKSSVELESINFGPYPVNKINFDPSGNILGVAGNDGLVKLYNTVEKSKSKNLDYNNGNSLQGLIFDKTGEFLVTCSSGMLDIVIST
ncbi:Sperm-associated antigen 16 protein [Lobulomyces angularis]|nr:Sperm-associated antigen 16 protein [Lobulomyces angularis]